MKEKDVVSLSKHPYTKDMLIYDFKQLGIKKGDCLLVHCSMSKLGWIIGREATLVQALIDTIGENGTIVMPSQTGDNSEPSLWNNPLYLNHGIKVLEIICLLLIVIHLLEQWEKL